MPALARSVPAQQQKERAKLLYPIMIQGGPNNQYQQFLEHGAREGFKGGSGRALPIWPGGGDRQASTRLQQLLTLMPSYSSTSFLRKTWVKVDDRDGRRREEAEAQPDHLRHGGIRGGCAPLKRRRRRC